HIMMYFNQKRHTLRSPDEQEQWRQVCAFKQHLPKEALSWDYNGKAQFERLVRRHLTQFLRYQQAQDRTTSASAQPVLSPALQHAYLTWVMAQVRAIPLTGVDPKSILEQSRRDLDLAAVYTALMTQRPAHLEERTVHPDREMQKLSALAVLNAEP